MAAEINFLKKRLDELNQFEKKDRQLFNIAFIIAIIASIILMFLISFRIYLNLRYNSIVKQQEQLKSEIEANQDIELSFLIFTNKLKMIRQLFDQRHDRQEAMEFISNLFGNEVFIEGMTFEEEGSILVLTLRVNSIFNLQAVFDTLNSEEVKNKFVSLAKHDLTRNNDGSYSFQVTLGLKSTLKKTTEQS